MALKRSKAKTDDSQLNLFSDYKNLYDNNADTIRHDSGRTLAQVSSEDGRGNGGQGSSGRNASGSGAENEGRDLRPDHAVSETRIDGATGARPGVGNGKRTLHLAAARSSSRIEQPRNQTNYRITEKDELGKGSLRKKCWNNI